MLPIITITLCTIIILLIGIFYEPKYPGKKNESSPGLSTGTNTLPTSYLPGEEHNLSQKKINDPERRIRKKRVQKNIFKPGCLKSNK